MLQNLTGWHAVLILAVVVLIFGAAKLPALARSVGQSVRILKDESRTDEPEAEADTASAPSDRLARVHATPAETTRVNAAPQPERIAS